MFRKGIFISYSHKDDKWRDVILTFLRPHIRGEKITVWSDTQIQPGANWQDEIISNLNSCRVAILLVTSNFLASDYIMNKELPVLLKRHQDGELIIYWIAISYSGYKTTPLAEIQSANNPKEPLDDLSKPEREKKLVEIAEKVSRAMNLNAIGNVLKVIDEFVPQQKAFISGEKFDFSRPRDYSIQAQQEQETIEFKSRTKELIETITADELEQLDSNSKILIRSYERTMQDLFERWTELQPKSYAKDPIIRQNTIDEMNFLRKDLCTQLNQILDYLIRQLHKNLDDHYHHVRHLCEQ